MFGLTVALSMRTWRNNIARSKPKGNGTSTSFENTAPWRRWIQHSSVFSRTLAAFCCNVLPQLYHLNLMTALLDDFLLGMKDNDSRKPGRGYNMWKYHEIGWNRCRFAWDMLGFFWQDAWVPAAGFLRRRGQDMHDGVWGASKKNVATRSFHHDDSMHWSRGIWYLSPLDHNTCNWILAFLAICRGEIPTADSSKRNVNQQVQEAPWWEAGFQIQTLWSHLNPFDLGAKTLSHIWMPAIHTCSNQLLIWS